MKILAALSALVGALIGFFLTGLIAASVLTAVLGDHDGGNSMGGFFGFGPVGAVAGALMAVGIVLRFKAGPTKWSKRFIVIAATLLVIGGIGLAVVTVPGGGPSYSEVIEFELEYPTAALAGIDIPGANAMWGAAGADMDNHPISQFFEKRCAADACVLNGSIAVLGPLNNFRIAAAIGGRKYSYVLDLPAAPTPMDWSAWHSGQGAKVRWRIVKR